MSVIYVPDPDPGRCSNLRWSDIWLKNFRCIDYEGVPHVCEFQIPPRPDPVRHFTTTRKPKPWVKPGDAPSRPVSAPLADADGSGADGGSPDGGDAGEGA